MLADTPVDVVFEGPFGFSGNRAPAVFEGDAAEKSGLYMWVGPGTDDNGWILYVGETSKPFRVRFLDHLQRQLCGSYSVYSLPECRQGVIRRLWSGYGWRGDGWRHAVHHLDKLEQRAAALREYLDYLEIWLAPLPEVPELRKRAEATLLEQLRKQGGAVRDLIAGNRSHFFAETDRKFTLALHCPRRLHGFPVDLLRA